LNSGYEQFFTKTFHDSTIEHEVIKNIKLLANQFEENDVQLQMHRYVNRSCELRVDGIRMHFGIGSKFIAICIGSSIPSKRLSTGWWVRAIQSILWLYSLPICILGGAEDRKQAAEIIAHHPSCIDLCGILSPVDNFPIFLISSPINNLPASLCLM